MELDLTDSPPERPPEKETKDVKISSADRIRELNQLDQDITRILEAAGTAVQSLVTSESGDGNNSLEASREKFEEQTNKYNNLVQSVSARLRRQVYALEEAKILAPNKEASRVDRPNAQQNKQGAFPGGAATGARAPLTAMQQRQDPPMQITNGGLGNFDIGWLNARSDKVARQKEAELWATAREFLEKSGDEEMKGGDGEMDVEEDSSKM